MRDSSSEAVAETLYSPELLMRVKLPLLRKIKVLDMNQPIKYLSCGRELKDE